MDKYDRQIRLWASSGQKRLRNSHVCLLNCTCAGAEVLKNLVLPGIGEFTVVDGDPVQESDLDGNFFFSDDSIGQNKAASMCESLQELNTDVQGHFYDKSVESLVESRTTCSAFFAPFSAVVLSGFLPEKVVQELKSVLWCHKIPFIVVSTLGFYGMVRVFSKETTIVETHDPSKAYDLRIDQPWHELRVFADSFDMESLDATDHAHVPYIVIFIKAVDRWRHDHANPPQNYMEKKLFQREYIQKMARDFGKEPNFLEASSAFLRGLQVTHVPTSVQALFEREEVRHIGQHSSMFWLFVHALFSFTELNGALPLPGSLPDMTSTTADYVKLQAIYREKAQKDKEQFMGLLRKSCEAAGRSVAEISDASVSVFCKNSAVLYVTNGCMQDYSKSMIEEVLEKLQDGKSNELVIYFAILAYHNWHDDGKRNDFEGYMQAFASLLTRNSPGTESVIGPDVKKTLQEVFRHSTTSYHNTCSLIGGVGAQELLKLLTCQYVPLDDLFVYDGIRSISGKRKVG